MLRAYIQYTIHLSPFYHYRTRYTGHSMARNTTPRPDRYRVRPVTPPIPARSGRLSHPAPLSTGIRVIPVTVIAKKALAKIVPAGPSRCCQGWHGSCYSIAQPGTPAKSMPTRESRFGGVGTDLACVIPVTQPLLTKRNPARLPGSCRVMRRAITVTLLKRARTGLPLNRTE